LRKELPRHRDASAAWHSARACRPLHALLRAAGVRKAGRNLVLFARAGEKVGQFK
jgi:hypothetical protein